jgi:hypothetical protein
MVPEPPSSLEAPAAPQVPPAAMVELLRSLERMEADLAEMRAEVERMRRHLLATRPAHQVHGVRDDGPV